MQLRFGAHRVGLQTGDGSLNIGQLAWLYGAALWLSHTRHVLQRHGWYRIVQQCLCECAKVSKPSWDVSCRLGPGGDDDGDPPQHHVRPAATCSRLSSRQAMLVSLIAKPALCFTTLHSIHTPVNVLTKRWNRSVV